MYVLIKIYANSYKSDRSLPNIAVLTKSKNTRKRVLVLTCFATYTDFHRAEAPLPPAFRTFFLPICISARALSSPIYARIPMIHNTNTVNGY